MGQLVNGKWTTAWYDTKSTGGRFQRTVTAFRDRIEPHGKFAPESGRYHLYVSLACPWAHRTLVVRSLKRLEQHIDVSVVNPIMLENGWTFAKDFPGATGDLVHNKQFLYQTYLSAVPDFSGRVTVPILWDKKLDTIVNNESAEIIEILNDAFNDLEGVNKDLDLAPESLRPAMNDADSWIYDTVNNGVYKAGFATSQQAYDEAVVPLFDSLDRLESTLAKTRYLTGSTLTLSDVRLWTTLVRFDHVYVTHFKCDRNRLWPDYPHLSAYLRDIYQTAQVAATVNLDHIRNHYFRSHPTINPHGILPIGPTVDWSQPADREKLGEKL